MSIDDNYESIDDDNAEDIELEEAEEQPRQRSRKEIIQNRIDWRRSKIMELYMSGTTNHYQIAQQLKISRSLVTKDLQFILAQSRDEIHNVIQDKLPLLYKKTDELLNFITTEALRIYQNASTDMQKIAALNLAKDTASQQFELSTNSTILSDAMHFVESHSQTLDNIQKALKQRDKEQQQQKEKEPKGEDLVEEEIQRDLSTILPEHSEDT